MYIHIFAISYLLATIQFGSLVGALSIPRLLPRCQTSNKTYTIQDFYQGSDFFSEWSYFTDADPTHGNVKYLDLQDAKQQNLSYVDSEDNTFVLAVDSTSNVPVGGLRNSVRISSIKTYNNGLFILDAVAMPIGCGVWSSFWTYAPDWPYNGEIDIVEGVNNQVNNQMSLHTGYTCAVADSADNGTFTGRILTDNCVSTTSTSGCSISDSDSASFGVGFNDAGGGVFAMLWESTNISIWRFPRANIPADITNKAPTPSSWGTPVAFWGNDACDIATNFRDQWLTFDTTICGDWAGGTYAESGKCPGTCSDIVANALNFVDGFKAHGSGPY